MLSLHPHHHHRKTRCHVARRLRDEGIIAAGNVTPDLKKMDSISTHQAMTVVEVVVEVVVEIIGFHDEYLSCLYPIIAAGNQGLSISCIFCFLIPILRGAAARFLTSMFQASLLFL